MKEKHDALLSLIGGEVSGAKRSSLVMSLIDNLTAAIKGGAFKPGDKLPTEAMLSSAAGVSRTVVREALASLKANGQVEIKQGSGVFVRAEDRDFTSRIEVTPQTIEDIISILEFRLTVEVKVAFLAAQRRTDEDLARIRAAHEAYTKARLKGADTVKEGAAFHLAIARAAHNRYFIHVLEELGEATLPRQRLNEEGRQVADQAGYTGEHEQLLKAIENRAASDAATVMHRHLNASLMRYKTLRCPNT